MKQESEIRSFLNKLLSEKEDSREYETLITSFADLHNSEREIEELREISAEASEAAYPAFFCLATIYRHNKDYTKLLEIITAAESREDFKHHKSLKHIRIMYETHSESLYDYDELLRLAHESACELYDNAGYQHTFANVFATICENCLAEDLDSILGMWYDSALYFVNRAIELEPSYAKYYSTKARIVIQKNRFEEASRLILKAIDLEDSRRKDYYAIRIGNYQYYRAMFAIKKQDWLLRRAGFEREAAHTPLKGFDSSAFSEMQPYVFVSYSHADAARIDAILGGLQANHINLWYDERIGGGVEWL